MTDDARLTAWMDEYRRAWTSNDPADIGALFTDDAEYRSEPFAEPWQGPEQIAEHWISKKDEPGTWHFSWQPVAIDGDTAVIRGETVYPADTTYSNLWVLRFAADGRCSSYTEWYMEQAQ